MNIEKKQMKKLKVEIIKDANKKPIGVRAAQVNGRDVVLALKDAGLKTWHEAVKIGVPSIAEWAAIYENKEAVNKALVKAGGEPLKDSWYWSSNEYGSNGSWLLYMGTGIYNYYIKGNGGYVRPVLAF